TNTQMFAPSDVNTFWQILNNILKENFNIVVEKEQWIVKRLDISYNFKVDNVSKAIIEISNKNLTKRNKIVYNENETVIFKNKSSSICFYDKEKECLLRKEASEVIEMSKGMLRLEIRPAPYHMRAYSPLRKANDLISKEYFIFIIEKFGINELFKSITIEEFDSDKVDLQFALNEMKATDVEKALGFSILMSHIGEKQLLENGHYKSGTIRNRKELLQQYSLTREAMKQKMLYVAIE
ncbi:phage/plasmid replication domain-containing protein, partial [Cytobacillus praedii]|uniref:phage/plasmid replication domain-containing protein n=1 Tax=Cytobacillus praedii TaxID=1742358 RepID=UPI0013F4403E